VRAEQEDRWREGDQAQGLGRGLGEEKNYSCLEDGVINADDTGLLGIKEYSDWPTIPQLYVGKEFVGGCDILISMHQSGELAKVLEEKGVLVPASEEGGEEGAPAPGAGGGDGAGKGGA
jgi:hypothetical protein